MLKKASLVIMAAGIGSRFGGGIKQLEPVGMNDEIIMEYSIYDAIDTGFNKIVFIIREDIKEPFRECVGERVEKICEKLGVEVAYAYQDINSVPEGMTVPPERTKPWGTGQAVLACKGIVNEPFVVINADDYYGKSAFRSIYEFLMNYNEGKRNSLCMAGFILKNTLSENGGVTRGICRVDKNGYLTDIVETYNIVKDAGGASADGVPINPDALASMNIWGLTPEFIDVLEVGFREFFQTDVAENPLKAEYLLPIYIGKLLGERKVSVRVIPTADKWFGITYREDKASVAESFKQLIDTGVYKENLFSDLI